MKVESERQENTLGAGVYPYCLVCDVFGKIGASICVIVNCFAIMDRIAQLPEQNLCRGVPNEGGDETGGKISQRLSRQNRPLPETQTSEAIHNISFGSKPRLHTSRRTVGSSEGKST